MNIDEHDDVKNPKFQVGWGVKKDKGSARYVGLVVATYITSHKERRYIVEIFPYKMQYIASYKELTLIKSGDDPDLVAYSLRNEAIALVNNAYRYYTGLNKGDTQ